MRALSWGLAAGLLAGTSGCTVTRWLEDGPPDETGIPDSPTDTGGACRLGVPDHVTLEAPVRGNNHVPFYVPHAGWALGALHASRHLDLLEREGVGLRLSPSWFFAIALETSFMGCSTTIPTDPADGTNTYAHQPSAVADGCLGLNDQTHLYDLCRLYPDELACTDETHEVAISSVLEETTGRDNVEPGLLATAWYAVFSYAMLQWSSGASLEDPDAWMAGASDPWAVEKLMAISHRESAYSSQVELAVLGCQDQAIEACWEETSPDQAALATGVASHVETLEAGLAEGHCYDRALTAAEVADYVAALGVLLDDVDLEAATSAAQTALGDTASAPFQQVADGVLDAIDATLPLTLRCPGSELTTSFAIGCPP